MDLIRLLQIMYCGIIFLGIYDKGDRNDRNLVHDKKRKK